MSIGAAAAAGSAVGEDWRTQYRELVFAVVPAENATGVDYRYMPFVAYLARELGTKVTLRIANDYAAVIEGNVPAISTLPTTGRRLTRGPLSPE
jgi:phosphonate transport system substrate-binding protein